MSSVTEPREVAVTALDTYKANDPARMVGTANRVAQAALSALLETVASRSLAIFKRPR